jgi:hypothetical protein
MQNLPAENAGDINVSLPRVADFPGWGFDARKRFAVTSTRQTELDAAGALVLR